MQNNNLNNSDASKRVQEREQLKPVGNGNVTVKKPSRFKKFKNTFFATDVKDVGGNLFTRVFIPGVQKLLTDSVKKAIDWIVYGEKGNPDRERKASSYVSYSSNWDRERSEPAPQRRSVIDVYSIEWEYMDDAQDALDQLKHMINKYGSARVADLYDLAGQDSIPVDGNYGWTNLDGVEVIRSGSKWRIDLPRVEVIR